MNNSHINTAPYKIVVEDPDRPVPLTYYADSVTYTPKAKSEAGEPVTVQFSAPILNLSLSGEPPVAIQLVGKTRAKRFRTTDDSLAEVYPPENVDKMAKAYA